MLDINYYNNNIAINYYNYYYNDRNTFLFKIESDLEQQATEDHTTLKVLRMYPTKC